MKQISQVMILRFFQEYEKFINTTQKKCNLFKLLDESHPGYSAHPGHINKSAASNDEPGLLHSIGSFFGAVGRGVSNAANWMWEAVKAPFSK